jgi:heat shock protein HtpX
MLPDFAGRSLLLACLALAPAAIRLARTRALASLADDAALGERLIAAQRGNTLALSTALVLVGTLSIPALWWGGPVMAIAYIAAGYPLRRAVFGETWSFPTYLSFTCRLLIAVSGFWILLALTPLFVHAAGSWDWMTGAAIGGLLVAWNTHSASIARYIMGTRPLADPALRERFEGLVGRFNIPPLRFEQVDLRGGFIPNAVALASLRGPAVVFTDTLLNLLEADESDAICAHELAHIEHYDTRRLRQLYVVISGLVVLAVAIPIAARVMQSSRSFVPWILWGAALVSALVWLARDRQKNETASDLRAVAATGNPEALVRALTRLYAAGRMPRRLQPDLERQATHPSLARRIRDIRAASGASEPLPPAGLTVTAVSTNTVVTFDRERLHWHEGETATHSLSYSHLSELRVHARGTGPALLVAVERSGRKWEVPLTAGDVAAVQAALDTVDGRLGEPVARSRWPGAARAIAAFAAVFSLSVGQAAAMLVAAFAMMQPSRRMHGAAGMASIAAGSLALRDQADGGYDVAISVAILAITAGTVLVILAMARRDDTPTTRRDLAPGFVIVVGVLAALALALLVAQARDVLTFHLWSRSLSAAAVLPLALAGALAFWDRPRVRYLSAPVAAAGLATMLAGFPAFLDAFGSDPLLVPAGAPSWKPLPPGPFAEFPLEFAATELRLSPGGRSIAVVAANETEEGPLTFHLGRAGESLVPLEATDLIFTDDEHVLFLESGGTGVHLRYASVSSPAAALWHQHVDGLLAAQLSVGRDRRTWHLDGREGSGRLVHVQGRIGGDAGVERRWKSNGRYGAMVAVASSGASAVVVETQYDAARPPLGLWQLAMFLPLPSSESFIRAVHPDGDVHIGASRLDVRCVAEQRGIERLACIAFDGTRSRVFSIDPETRRIAPVIQMDGRLFSYARLSSGWLTGWHAQGPVALRLDTREAFRVASSANEVISQLSPADRVIGALAYHDGISTVRLYALE